MTHSGRRKEEKEGGGGRRGGGEEEGRTDVEKTREEAAREKVEDERGGERECRRWTKAERGGRERGAENIE